MVFKSVLIVVRETCSIVWIALPTTKLNAPLRKRSDPIYRIRLS